MDSTFESFRLISAGGVVYESKGNRTRIVLCGRGRPRLWCLPKGTPEDNESIEATAIREVEEETGLEVEIQDIVGSTHYEFFGNEDNVHYKKTVRFFLMRPKGGSILGHDEEFEEVRWFPIDEALRLIRYPNEGSIVEQAIDRIETRRKSV